MRAARDKQTQDGGEGGVPHGSRERLVAASIARSTASPETQMQPTVKMYGPNWGYPSSYAAQMAPTVAPVTKTAVFSKRRFAAKKCRASSRWSLMPALNSAVSATCLPPDPPASGAVLMTLASFAMVLWVMIRGMA